MRKKKPPERIIHDETAEFMRLMELQNARIAAREKQKEAEVDHIRIQREKEYREKYGKLRARRHNHNQN